MKRIKILTTVGEMEPFNGEHQRSLETQNWHYFRTAEGVALHFRKEHLVMVSEQEIEDCEEVA